MPPADEEDYIPTYDEDEEDDDDAEEEEQLDVEVD